MKNLPLVPDDLWEAIEPLLPEEPPKPKGDRPRVPDRAASGGIIFVLRTSCPSSHPFGEAALTATALVCRCERI
jgi:transposase